jgi:hypothetical protein
VEIGNIRFCDILWFCSRYKLVKSIYMVASVLRKEAEAAEERRIKKLRDAEELLRKEQARMHGGI